MRRAGEGYAVPLVVLGLLMAGTGCGTDCSKLKQEAADLTNEYSSCSPGDRCVIVNMYDLAGSNNCLPAFQCSLAVRDSADQSAFASRAHAISDEFKAGCKECSTASCQGATSTTTAECNTATRRCEIVW